MTPEEKLRSMDIALPAVPQPLGSYVPFVRTGNLVYISGMLPLKSGQLEIKGVVGRDVTLEDAKHGARTAAINALAVLKAAVGDLGKVKRCVQISGFVASAQGFTDQPKVINGASDLIFEVFGEAGLHTRTAVGVNILPIDSPVEIAFIFEAAE